MSIPNKKPLYLGGPMSHIPQFNYPAFDKAAVELRDMGYQIQSPAELDDQATRAAALASKDGSLGSGSVNNETWGDFLARDVKLIADGCSGVVLLDGWENSRGAKLEVFVAMLCNYPVYKYSADAEPKLRQLTYTTINKVLLRNG